MVDTSIQIRYVTEAELMALGSDARVEVIKGEIVEMSPTGARHVVITDNYYRVLYPSVIGQKLGYLFTDSLIYYLSRDGERLYDARVPDASFIRKDRVPPDWNIDLPFPGAPTLAIEVVSPNDSIEEVLDKVRQYLDSGTEQVWLTLPKNREVHVYKRGESQVFVYHGDDTMDVSDLFPGLTLSLKDIFALPELD
jgi:Uma2 family endonuclease